MPTRHVILSDDHVRVIDALVSSGRFRDASEVVQEGLRLIEEREARDHMRQASLQDAARLGFSDLAEGRYRDLHDSELEVFIADLGRLTPREAAARMRAARPSQSLPAGVSLRDLMIEGRA